MRRDGCRHRLHPLGSAEREAGALAHLQGAVGAPRGIVCRGGGPGQGPGTSRLSRREEDISEEGYVTSPPYDAVFDAL